MNEAYAAAIGLLCLTVGLLFAYVIGLFVAANQRRIVTLLVVVGILLFVIITLASYILSRRLG